MYQGHSVIVYIYVENLCVPVPVIVRNTFTLKNIGRLNKKKIVNDNLKVKEQKMTKYTSMYNNSESKMIIMKPQKIKIRKFGKGLITGKTIIIIILSLSLSLSLSLLVLILILTGISL